MATSIAELKPSEQSKVAFWKMINVARERGWVSLDDVQQWAEWEMQAWLIIAISLYFPFHPKKAIALSKNDFLEKKVTADKLLESVEYFLRDVWNREPAKSDKFFSP